MERVEHMEPRNNLRLISSGPSKPVNTSLSSLDATSTTSPDSCMRLARKAIRLCRRSPSLAAYVETIIDNLLNEPTD